MKKNPALSLIAALGVGAVIAFGTPGASLARADTEKAKPSAATAAPARDVLILKSGKTVEGKILEETATTIRFEVRIGSIASPTTYEKSEILEIKRGVASNPAESDTKATETNVTKTETPSTGLKKDKDKDKDEDARRAPTGDENAKKIYLVELKDRWGIHVSETPIAKICEDIARVNPDIVVFKMDTRSPNNEQGEDDFDSLFRTETIAPPIEKLMSEQNRRVVFWVENALGGASFLPFISPEIYFTEEALLGGIGDLGDFNMGDHMVNEKQISLRLGHAEGMFVKGGYAPELVRAMARADYWLYVRFEGGKPIYNMPLEKMKAEDEVAGGWTLLSDDGKGDRKDKSRISGKPNDTLNLDAVLAKQLGVSDGTATSIDQLADLLGVGTNYVVLKDTRGPKIIKDWKNDIDDAISKITRNPQRLGKLWVELNETPEQGGTPDEVRKALGKRLQILRQIRSIMATYAELFDPEGQQRAQLDVRIEELKAKLAAVNKAIQNAPPENSNRRN